MNKDKQILITIEGGLVQSVRANFDIDANVVIRDLDILGQSGEKLQDLEVTYMETHFPVEVETTDQLEVNQ